MTDLGKIRYIILIVYSGLFVSIKKDFSLQEHIIQEIYVTSNFFVRDKQTNMNPYGSQYISLRDFSSTTTLSKVILGRCNDIYGKME